MLVERLELPDEGSAILEDDSHPVVDVRLHFIVLTDNHVGYL